MNDTSFQCKVENYIMCSCLSFHNSYIKANLDYLITFTWIQKDMFMLPFRQLEEIGEIRKIKKDNFRKAYNIIKSEVKDEDQQVNAFADSIKEILNSNPFPLDFPENSSLSNVEKIMQLHPAIVIKSEIYPGYSILFGENLVGAAFIQNALKCNVDIEDSTAYLNVYYGRKK